VTPDQVESQELNPEAYVVVGIDPGVRKTATATMVTAARHILEPVDITRFANWEHYPTCRTTAGKRQ